MIYLQLHFKSYENLIRFGKLLKKQYVLYINCRTTIIPGHLLLSALFELGIMIERELEYFIEY